MLSKQINFSSTTLVSFLFCFRGLALGCRQCDHVLLLHMQQTKEHILSRFEAKFEDSMIWGSYPLAIAGMGFIVLTSMLLAPSYFNWYIYNPGGVEERMVAYAVTKGKLPCNCTLDFLDGTVGIELPNVKIIKNESMLSQTEGRLEWNESRQLALDGELVGDVYLANQSSGALVDLNTISVKDNQLLRIEVTGGSQPDIVRAELLNLKSSTLNDTGLSLGDVIIDSKLSDYVISYNKNLVEPTSEENSFRVHIPSKGEYILILYLTYQEDGTNNFTNNSATTNGDLTAIYKTFLSVRG
jgi:hypothetical protein